MLEINGSTLKLRFQSCSASRNNIREVDAESASRPRTRAHVGHFFFRAAWPPRRSLLASYLDSGD